MRPANAGAAEVLERALKTAQIYADWINDWIQNDYRRLKSDENSRLSLNWNLNIEQNIEQPKRLELLRATAIKQLRTIIWLDFTSQKILSISEKNEE
ncbi:hypothetical protein [Treponema bryantii]|uniref:hypothetical protein n=1 Tax=Treponema bryantii TaxID=163 RepID=UPI0003B2EE9F|nr:hypothetical protein [Treponema bryantii]